MCIYFLLNNIFDIFKINILCIKFVISTQPSFRKENNMFQILLQGKSWLHCEGSVGSSGQGALKAVESLYNNLSDNLDFM